MRQSRIAARTVCFDLIRKDARTAGDPTAFADGSIARFLRCRPMLHRPDMTRIGALKLSSSFRPQADCFISREPSRPYSVLIGGRHINQTQTNMNTEKPAFPRLSGARLMLSLALFIGLGTAWPVFAQTATPTSTASPQANPQLKSWITTSPESLKERLFNTAQVPDELPKPNLADLLREENRRLKQRVEALEKENAELKAKLGGK